jgi:hypothetical protein
MEFDVSRWTCGAVLLLLSLLGGCGREPQPGTELTRERFIETNVALRAIPRDTLQADSVAQDSLRQAVLAEHGTTEEELRGFVMALSERPGELAAVWSEIHERLMALELGDPEDPARSGMLRESDLEPEPPHVEEEPDTVAPEGEQAREPGAPRRPRPALRAS